MAAQSTSREPRKVRGRPSQRSSIASSNHDARPPLSPSRRPSRPSTGSSNITWSPSPSQTQLLLSEDSYWMVDIGGYCSKRTLHRRNEVMAVEDNNDEECQIPTKQKAQRETSDNDLFGLAFLEEDRKQ